MVGADGANGIVARRQTGAEHAGEEMGKSISNLYPSNGAAAVALIVAIPLFRSPSKQMIALSGTAAESVDRLSPASPVTRPQRVGGTLAAAIAYQDANPLNGESLPILFGDQEPYARGFGEWGAAISGAISVNAVDETAKAYVNDLDSLAARDLELSARNTSDLLAVAGAVSLALTDTSSTTAGTLRRTWFSDRLSVCVVKLPAQLPILLPGHERAVVCAG